MNKKLEKLEIQKLLQEYSFLLLDEEYKNEVIDVSKTDFLSKVREMIGAQPELTEPKNPSDDIKVETNKQIDPSNIDKSTRDKVKKLYREIAKLTHPDKVDSDSLIDLYMKSTVAAEEFDLFTLYEICEKLNIEHDIDPEDKSILRSKIDSKKEKLKNIENSFIWLYAHARTEEEKNILLHKFIEKHGNNF
jgi:hypothetical protein